MTCDQFLASLVAGGPLRRRRARRHAARCARCAEIQAQVQSIARELSEVAPLTAAQRALWTAASAAKPEGSQGPARGRPAWLAVAAAAVVIFIAIALRSTWNHTVQQATPLPIVKTPRSAKPGTGSELFTAMRADLDRFDRELTALRRQADLIDVRKDAEALWARYAGRASSTPL
jgi:hypothetical protein